MIDGASRDRAEARPALAPAPPRGDHRAAIYGCSPGERYFADGRTGEPAIHPRAAAS